MLAFKNPKHRKGIFLMLAAFFSGLRSDEEK
jgi:hypothetical protein